MRPIEKIAVVGAGNMGSGIAQKFATEGFSVLLLDIDEAALKRGQTSIERTLAEGVERKIFRSDQAEQIRQRIEATLDWSRLREIDLVIEAVFEDLEVKRDVFRRLAEATRADCLLATNTSSFYVRQIAETTPHPERVLGLHYFYHPAKNRLVEVIAGPQTPSESVRRAWLLQEQIGKTPIASADAPGFVVNRFFVPWINEAARLLEEKVADAATIEQAAIEGFRIGMGPFQLMNVTGIPIGYHAAATLARELGPFYKPSGIIKEYMESGRLFELPGFDVAGGAGAATPGAGVDRSKFSVIQERLLGVTFHVACQLVSEGVGSIEDVDIGARVGLRWARGPFEMMNKIGIAETARISGELEKRYGLETPRLLRDQLAAGKPFAIRLVRMEVADGVATITFNRPDAMNALNPAVAEQFEAALDQAIADPAVQGIVLTGAGKAFVAGADIRFFIENMKAGTHERIAQFAQRGQDLYKKIERSPKPVVARLNGMALGGGLEMALACDSIVAADRAVLAFPETGIGIYPGLGGTQRTSRRIGKALTKWMVYTGQFVDAVTADKIGLIDWAGPYEGLDRAVAEALTRGKRALERLGPARSNEAVAAAIGKDPMFSGLIGLFDRISIDAVMDGAGSTNAGGASSVPEGAGSTSAGGASSVPAGAGSTNAGGARSVPAGAGSTNAGGASSVPAGDAATIAAAEKILGKVRTKAPVALRLCETLIDKGGDGPLDEGLAMEMAQMEEIFRTEDALEGLSTMGRKKPEFRGK